MTDIQTIRATRKDTRTVNITIDASEVISELSEQTTAQEATDKDSRMLAQRLLTQVQQAAGKVKDHDAIDQLLTSAHAVASELAPDRSTGDALVMALSAAKLLGQADGIDVDTYVSAWKESDPLYRKPGQSSSSAKTPAKTLPFEVRVSYQGVDDDGKPVTVTLWQAGKGGRAVKGQTAWATLVGKLQNDYRAKNLGHDYTSEVQAQIDKAYTTLKDNDGAVPVVITAKNVTWTIGQHSA